MKVYLKRDKSNDNSRYIVTDELGVKMFTVCGRFTKNAEHLYIMHDELCVAKIRNTSISLLRTCHVKTDRDDFRIVIASKHDKTAITYHGVNFRIRGNVTLKSYDILDVDNSVLACVQKRYNTSNETLELNIDNDKNLLSCIASAVCLNTSCLNDALTLQTI